MNRNYFDYRKQLYASINGRIGNLIRLSKSKLLKKDELALVLENIENLKNLSSTIKNNGI